MTEDKMRYKSYLGDGVYADYNGFQIVLTTEDGVQILNTIFLEGEVWYALERYVKDLKEDLQTAL